MEYMRTQASIEKFVIITMRDGRKKYVGRRYSFKMDYGYTVKINEAMMFDTEKLAERKMEELRIKGQIGKVVKSYELKEIFDRRRRMIYTVFPKQEGEMPQDFPTYLDAQEYGDEEFGRGNYTIESTTGECV